MITSKALLLITFSLLFLLSDESESKSESEPKPQNPKFVTISSQHFTRDSRPYYFLGANFWYGINLAASSTPKIPSSNRPRIPRELDNLKSQGITNLRILGISQGPDTTLYRMKPAVEETMGEFGEVYLEALDYLLDEMGKREMTAVIYLGNYWAWSGGFPQYVSWVSGESIPFPSPRGTASFDEYCDFISLFYIMQDAMEDYWKFIRLIVNRNNTVNGVLYKEDPTIMSWQTANEPRPHHPKYKEAYQDWIRKTGELIKGIDNNHLFSLGNEGTICDPDQKQTNQMKVIDYITVHCWAQNWEWYDPKDNETYQYAVGNATDYLDENLRIAGELGKPLVLEEFGLARDGQGYTVTVPTTYKDKYYDFIFKYVYEHMKNAESKESIRKEQLSGVNFWAWAGEGRATTPGGYWQKGDTWIGDPPHEPQGWYSVFDVDSTVDVISHWAGKINNLNLPAHSNGGRLAWWAWLLITIALAGVCALVVWFMLKKWGKNKGGQKYNKEEGLICEE